MFNPWDKFSNGAKDALIRWTYLIIVIAASVTMLFLLRENRQIVEDIQNDRKRVTFDLCLDQNSRHDELMQFLSDQEGFNPTTRKFIVEFIDLSTPKRNCPELIMNTFGEPINENS